MSTKKPRFVNFLQEFSIPLLAGVVVALVHANLDAEGYHHLVERPLGFGIFGHEVTLHFLVNDVFMVFFFGIAAKEITEACLPGGNLNPIGKALNPLLATFGGVLGPIGVFFVSLFFATRLDVFGPEVNHAMIHRGWGIPTATDIALAWLVARAVFGPGHPAINFLLLLAVADDGIGLVIIALFYGDPQHPAAPIWLLLVLAGMLLALGLRLARVRRWVPYVALAGPLAWSGLVLANLHPALALVFVVPFMPAPRRDTGLFVELDEVDEAARSLEPGSEHHSTLHLFERDLKLFVDLGLFFFAYANAGVPFAGIGPMTWMILGSLVIGKVVGITAFGWLATKIGFPLPSRMGFSELAMAGLVAAMGLTVALFVAGAAFGGGHAPILEGQAKMGALLSGVVGIVAVVLGRALGMHRRSHAASDRGSAAATAETATEPPSSRS